MFFVWIESWTGLRVAPALRLLAVEVAARSLGSGDIPTRKRVRTAADSIVAVAFGLWVICMAICYLQSH